MRFILLGPMTASAGCGDVPLGPPQQRGLLALLLLKDAPVAVADIVDALWGEQAPLSARSIVRTYATRLRQTFATSGSHVTLTRTAAGYQLLTHDATVDSGEFAALIEQAGRTRDPASTARSLRQALDLWRGPVLGGVHAEFATGQRTRLEALHRSAREQWFEAELALGRHEVISAELVGAAQEDPLDGRLAELAMIALSRSGRIAEALQVFRRSRAVHRQELGVEPGPGLQELHRRILSSRPVASVPSPFLRPDQMPSDLADFIGRGPLIDDLERTLTANRPVVGGLTGLGGNGKTALAVHLAHRLKDAFPDGRLYADLGARTGKPALPQNVLAHLLRTVAPDLELPATLEERSALWRSVVSGRRMFLVLDDADSSSQVAPLLPGAPEFAVIVTSTRRLLELPNVYWQRVGPLTVSEGRDLLSSIVGADRIQAEPDSTEHLLQACSCQPLSVRIAAARLLDRPLWSVRQIMDQLEDDLRQPVVMHEDCAIVDEPIRRAEARLSPSSARVFRVAALPATARRTVAEVAALLDVSADRARAALEDVLDSHLVEPVDFDSYRYPSLVQAYGRRRAIAVEGEAFCRAALARIDDMTTVLDRV